MSSYVVPLWAGVLIAGIVDLAIALAASLWAWQRLKMVSEPMRSAVGSLVGPPRADATPEELRRRIESTRQHLDETLSALEHKTDLFAPMRDTALVLGSLGVAVARSFAATTKSADSARKGLLGFDGEEVLHRSFGSSVFPARAMSTPDFSVGRALSRFSNAPCRFSLNSKPLQVRTGCKEDPFCVRPTSSPNRYRAWALRSYSPPARI